MQACSCLPIRNRRGRKTRLSSSASTRISPGNSSVPDPRGSDRSAPVRSHPSFKIQVGRRRLISMNIQKYRYIIWKHISPEQNRRVSPKNRSKEEPIARYLIVFIKHIIHMLFSLSLSLSRSLSLSICLFLSLSVSVSVSETETESDFVNLIVLLTHLLAYLVTSDYNNSDLALKQIKVNVLSQ